MKRTVTIPIRKLTLIDFRYVIGEEKSVQAKQ